MREILTIQHYDEDIKKVKRITLAADKINFVSADTEDAIVNGLSVRPVKVYFESGEVMDATVSHSDLAMMEKAIGTFYID